MKSAYQKRTLNLESREKGETGKILEVKKCWLKDVEKDMLRLTWGTGNEVFEYLGTVQFYLRLREIYLFKYIFLRIWEIKKKMTKTLLRHKIPIQGYKDFLKFVYFLFENLLKC